MKKQYKMYGWDISHYSGKLRGYLNYKNLDFEECPINAYQLTQLFPRKVGSLVMPVLLTNKGEWLSDTADIIEELEQRHPTPSVFPCTPRKLIASLILSIWADEFWTPSTMHYRWSFPENYPRFREEAGNSLLPYTPKFVKNWVADNIPAKKMRSYLPSIGVTKEQLPIIENWTNQQLDLLEEHFSQHAYLLGDQPTVADHALIGPLYAHLYGDPVPKRILINSRPNLKQWIERTHRGEKANGEFLSDDSIPPTLVKVFEGIFKEFYPMIMEIAKATATVIQENKIKGGDSLPRSLNTIRFPMAGATLSRIALPFSLWKAQSVQQRFLQMPTDEQESIQTWLKTMGFDNALKISLGPALERHGLATKLK